MQSNYDSLIKGSLWKILYIPENFQETFRVAMFIE